MRRGFQNTAQNRGAFFGRVFCHCQRAHRKRGVADKIPVRGVIDTPDAGLLIDRDHLVQSLRDNGVANSRPLVGSERVVKPVIADRTGVSHLGGIDQSAGIPVSERGSGVHFLHGASKPRVAPGEPVHERERNDSIDGAPRLYLQPGANQPVFDWWNGEKPVAFLFKIAVNVLSPIVLPNQKPNAIEIGIDQDEARVGRPKLSQRIAIRGRAQVGMKIRLSERGLGQRGQTRGVPERQTNQ